MSQEKKNNTTRYIDLKTDMTQTQLMELLNKKFGFKKFSTKGGKTFFTPQDIQGYARRGVLPMKYGGNKLKVIKHDSLTIIRVSDLSDIMSKPDFEESKVVEE